MREEHIKARYDAACTDSAGNPLEWSHEAVKADYLKKFTEALEDEAYAGKSDKDIFHALTKDDGAAFKHAHPEVRLKGAEPIGGAADELAAAKAVMGRQAAELVSDGMVLLLDASTSAFHLIPYLSEKKELIVVTSGAKTALALAEAGICTYSTGGRMLIHSFSYVGSQAERFLADINADLAFFSCRGLSDDGEISDSSVEEVNLRRVMISRSRKSYLLCDGSKFGKTYFYTLCRADSLAGVISDRPLNRRADDAPAGNPAE